MITMPVCEADPWRLQYFENVHCPPEVNIPTEDSDAGLGYPKHRWIYDKIAIAHSQGLEAAPHGVAPSRFPVFSKPIINLRGMGTASRLLRSGSAMPRVCRAGKARSTTGRCTPRPTRPSRIMAAPGSENTLPAIPAF